MAVVVTMEDVPVHLMPVALVLLYVTAGLWGRVAAHHASKTFRTSKALRYGVMGTVTFVSYCLVVGRIEGSIQKAVHSSFDPYQVLDLGTSQHPVANLTKALVTDKYKEKVKYYHPTNPDTGNVQKLHDVMDAFQALTDEDALRRWKSSGHPKGPLLTPVFQFAVPRWLFVFGPGGRPTGAGPDGGGGESNDPDSTEIRPPPLESQRSSLTAVHVAMLSYVLYWLYGALRGSRSGASSSSAASSALDDLNWNLESNTVHDLDYEYLANHVRPDMSAMDVLLLALSAPTNLVWGQRDVERIEALKRERVEKLQKPKRFNYDDFLQEGGWAADEDDDNNDNSDEEDGEARERRRAEREAEEKRKAAAAAGAKMEGVDDGVLGQQWVERTLQAAGEWPPASLGCLTGRTFEWTGSAGGKPQMLPTLEHPVMRRLLCFFTGRLNAQMLNSHPELVQAGINKLIDPTYFQSSLVFRHRMNILLETVLRIGMSLQSRRLVRTGVEASALFKIGTKPGSEAAFRDMMIKQYGVAPQLNLTTLEVATEGESEIATGESTQMTFEVERLHAENFLRQKLQQLQQQGIPPQVGLQAYREGWWFLVSCERIDGKGAVTALNRDDELVKKMNVSESQIALFSKEKLEDRLLATLPMMLGNISQKSFKASGAIKAPSVAGTYRFALEIKSMEFLGADVTRSVEVQVVDASKLSRKLKQDPGEPKKDK